MLQSSSSWFVVVVFYEYVAKLLQCYFSLLRAKRFVYSNVCSLLKLSCKNQIVALFTIKPLCSVACHFFRVLQARHVACVARNEVKNASFAQRSAHRDSRIWRPELIDSARAAVPFDRNWPIPTHTFCHSAIFHPNTPCNVWFFWVSRHMSIILAKKMETFSGRFWEIPGNMWNLNDRKF